MHCVGSAERLEAGLALISIGGECEEAVETKGNVAIAWPIASPAYTEIVASLALT